MSERASIFAADDKPDGGGNVGNESNASGVIDATGSEQSTARPRFSFVDPGSLGDTGSNGTGDGGAAGEPVRKRRGRKPGSRNSQTAQTISVSGLAEIIVNTHAMLAAFTKSAELFVDMEEAQKLAEATVNVSRHYNVAVAAKTVDWVNFATVAGMIYGTRLVAINNRRKMERRNNPAKPAPTTTARPTGDAADSFYRGLDALAPDMTQFQAG